MRNKLPILLALMLDRHRRNALAAVAGIAAMEHACRADHRSATQPDERAGRHSIPPLPPREGPEVNAIDRGASPLPSASAAPQASPNVAAHSNRRADARRPPQPSQFKPQSLVDYAVMAVESQEYISAKISEEGELFSHPLAAAGSYFEHREGPIPLLRIELTVQVDSVSTYLLQVCDGNTIWTYRKLPNGESLAKLDAGRAITALDQAASRLPSAAALATPGLGGLGRLMRGIERHVRFCAGGAGRGRRHAGLEARRHVEGERAGAAAAGSERRRGQGASLRSHAAAGPAAGRRFDLSSTRATTFRSASTTTATLARGRRGAS